MRSRRALVLVVAACAGVSCVGDAPPGGGREAEGGRSGTEPAAAADSLILLARADSLSPTRLPPDWYDLLHPRFANRIAFPDPGEFPLARSFMETVMRAEAVRTGQPESGLDWLLRWDGSVAVYYGDVAGGILPFRRGEVVLLVIPASQAGGLVDRDEVVTVPLESGGLPRITFPGTSGAGEGTGSADVELPPDWLSTWRTRVQGRHPAR